MNFLAKKSWHVKTKSAVDRVNSASKEHKELSEQEEKLKKERNDEFERQRPYGKKGRRNRKNDEVDPTEVMFMYEQPQEVEERERPEDIIPDLPENQEVREFLRKAPTSGLWMPLGKEVKTMKCWRCGAYGHRTGDRDCPKFLTGSEQVENFHKRHEDPMAGYVKEINPKEEAKAKAAERVEYYKSILEKEKRKREKKKGEKERKHKHVKKENKDRRSKKRRRNRSSSSSSDSDRDNSERRERKRRR